MKCCVLLIILASLVQVFTKRPNSPLLTGKSCTRKVLNFCKRNCYKAECENFNKKEPKPKTNRRRYCKRVKCIKPVETCVCPMYHEPVCDENGNSYGNIDCAQCEGLNKDEVSPCTPFQNVIFGTESPE